MRYQKLSARQRQGTKARTRASKLCTVTGDWSLHRNTQQTASHQVKAPRPYGLPAMECEPLACQNQSKK